MTENIGGGRTLHVCDLCGAVDDHPRHSLLGGVEGVWPRPEPEIVLAVVAAVQDLPATDAQRLIAELLDTGTTDRHLDCCRAAGCPDRTCHRQTEGAEDLRGADLLAHLDSLREERP